jgi:hypothetical protein
MAARNERAPGERGAGDAAVCSDGRDPITTPQGSSQRDRARALLTRLRVEYPVLGEYRPLAIGIRGAVHAAWPDGAHKTINCALAMHCRCDAYLKALAAGGSRHDLAGAPSGEVSEAHRAAAVLVLARRAETSAKPPKATPPRPGPRPPLLRLAKPRRRP